MSGLVPKSWFEVSTNDFKPQYEDKRLNEGDIDCELFQRTPDDFYIDKKFYRDSEI